MFMDLTVSHEGIVPLTHNGFAHFYPKDPRPPVIRVSIMYLPYPRNQPLIHCKYPCVGKMGFKDSTCINSSHALPLKALNTHTSSQQIKTFRFFSWENGSLHFMWIILHKMQTPIFIIKQNNREINKDIFIDHHTLRVNIEDMLLLYWSTDSHIVHLSY